MANLSHKSKSPDAPKNSAGRILRIVLIATFSLLLAFLVATIGINGYIISSTRDDIHTIAQVEERGIHADAIVVLGASVFANGTPSDILADRLEVAADLLK